MNRIKRYFEFINESIKLWNGIEVEESLEKLKKGGKYNIRGIFTCVYTFPGGADLVDELWGIIESSTEINNWEKYFKKFIYLENRLSAMVSNAAKGKLGKRVKMSTKTSTLQSPKVTDNFSLAYKNNQQKVDKILGYFEKTLQQIKK